MTNQVLIAGGGMGGMAAALALARAGSEVGLFERTSAFSDVGAGIQLGPNVVKVLQHWGLAEALKAVAVFPERLEVRSAVSAKVLGVLPLGQAMVRRYGAAYACVHRADLHALLLQAVQQHTGAVLHLDRPLQGFTQTPEAVTVELADGVAVQGDVLVGADGLWSTVRQQLLGDGPPRRSGHLAYRALLPQASLPARLRCAHVSVWLGPRMHIVHYPVRGGEWLNVVAIVQGDIGPEAATWDHQAHAEDLAAALAGSHAQLRDLMAAIAVWRCWPVCDRAPMQGAGQHALGRVALLGDAAHPMRPYLAQGAGMAIEDAAELERLLHLTPGRALDVPALLQRYALKRWQRNARVQARAIRNGEIFHAQGWRRWGRDTAMTLLGEKLLDMPWLYSGAS